MSGPRSPAGLPGASSTSPPVAGSAGGPAQRWRLYLRLPAAEVPGALPAGAGAWAALLAQCGLPLAGSPGKARVVPAAPLPLGIAGEREILDLVLAERLTAADVRDRVRAGLPPLIELVDLHDVWVGAPAAPADLVAADYRVEVAGPTLVLLELAAGALMDARSLPHERHREKRTQAFDLRPLIIALSVAASPTGAVAAGREGATLLTRLRHHTAGVGRPEDVVAALAEPPAPPLDSAILVVRIVRERLLTADDARRASTSEEVIPAGPSSPAVPAERPSPGGP